MKSEMSFDLVQKPHDEITKLLLKVGTWYEKAVEIGDKKKEMAILKHFNELKDLESSIQGIISYVQQRNFEALAKEVSNESSKD